MENVELIELPVLRAETTKMPFPDIPFYASVSDNPNLLAIKTAEDYQNLIAIFIDTDGKNHRGELYSQICSIAKIKNNIAMPGKKRRLFLESLKKARIHEVFNDEGCLKVKLEICEEVLGNEEEIEPLISLVKKELKDLNTNKDAFNYGITDKPGHLCDLIALHYFDDHNFLLKLFEELNVSNRFKLLLNELKSLKLNNELEEKIESEVRRSINESQKEYYLREKMKAIQNELGESAKKEEDIEKLKQKIKEAKMPKEVEEMATKELNRYRSSSFNSGETGVIRTYLDFVVSLPWSNSSEDSDDIKKAKQILDDDHYGLDVVKERILEYLAVRILNKHNPQSILCLVGPPGVGKTSLARSVASALNKKFVKESLGGVADEVEIRGHRRTYIGALPGRILQSLKKAGTNNPVFLLDEIDKLGRDYKGDPTSALLEVLDPEQNKFFSDHYLEVPFDLSKVFFICTANYIGNIPAPLRDRMEIVELSSYTEYEKFEIAKRHLIAKQVKLHGLDSDKLTISDQAIYEIIQKYTKETGVRELERCIGRIIRKGIKKILMEDAKSIEIDTANLEEYLGKQKYFNNVVEKDDRIGVVTGLAYTEFGGDTLDVEVTYYKGGGHLVLTGNLGNVMKESAQAALSYVKSNATKFGIDEDLLVNNDVHIHVPEGAIPKDGPSAGVTITTAIVSALSNHKVHHELGMTGEITLRGRVLPIGGLKEKSIAAKRSGLEKILIPYENTKDIADIPDSVKAGLEIVPVKTIDEVLEHALVK